MTVTSGRSHLFEVGLVVLGILALVAVFAPLLSSYDPDAIAGPALQSP
ncbi:MAG: ABC transporter permease, partial [Acidimicrobiia bacterium]|nr:ABC transporter permease [Acidimicrobiia bacterium]